MSDAESFEQAIATALNNWNISVNADQIGLFRRHFEAMVEANRIMNLTRITGTAEAATKHFADSLSILPWAAAAGLSQMAVLDIGTGAGYPAVPLAIMCPDWTIVAIDGTAKKAGFVTTVALELGLKNLTVEHAHSDHWPSTRKFDLVTTRAVASLAKCMRSAHPRLKQGGRLVAYKSAVLTDEETQEAKTAVTELGMEIEPPFVYELRLGDELLKRALRPVRRIR